VTSGTFKPLRSSMSDISISSTGKNHEKISGIFLYFSTKKSIFFQNGQKMVYFEEKLEHVVKNTKKIHDFSVYEEKLVYFLYLWDGL